jgi:hypothetical protein
MSCKFFEVPVGMIFFTVNNNVNDKKTDILYSYTSVEIYAAFYKK